MVFLSFHKNVRITGLDFGVDRLFDESISAISIDTFTSTKKPDGNFYLANITLYSKNELYISLSNETYLSRTPRLKTLGPEICGINLRVVSHNYSDNLHHYKFTSYDKYHSIDPFLTVDYLAIRLYDIYNNESIQVYRV